MKHGWHKEVIRVHYKDTDQMGVVHHGNYVNLFEIGRTEWMRHAGIPYSKMEDMGLLLPVMDLNINYQKSARYDDLLVIYTKVSHFSKVRLQFDYEARLINDSQGEIADTPTGELLAKGSTVHMWVTRDWKPARIDRLAPDVYALFQEA
ncbi:acyl-CoA thioesterase [Oceanobacillus manasiensis]|uniref:acyl-CoA thioesterase n=1 Tax=Oceanobacillus manasiensis TaxID=586413 RepID=UPI0005AAA27D|nr:thioesterase family protein [Oceanobacillus manasiensis]